MNVHSKERKMLTKTKENSKKNLTKQDILNSVLISTHYTLKVLSGFVISAIVSIFGLFPLVQSFFDSERSLYITIFGFVFLLILIDSIKRGTLTRYYNSKLKNIIQGSKIRKGYLNVSLMAIIFVLLIDGAGAWLTGVAGQNFYTERKAVQSEEYKILKQNAKSGQTTADNYVLELQAWKETKAESYANCDDKWKGWKAKYKAKCKEDWNNFNPMPKQTSTGQIKIDDYKDIEEDNKSFLDEYLQYIIFIVLVLLTGLLQYLTISEIKEDYEDTEESLTPNRVTNLQTAIATAQDIEEQHEKATFQNKEKLQEKKNEQFREMKILEDKRDIVLNAKAVNNGNEGLKRIANNNAYVPSEESKAGFYHNPFANTNNQKDRDYTGHDMFKYSDTLHAIIEDTEIGQPLNLSKEFEIRSYNSGLLNYYESEKVLEQRNGEYYKIGERYDALTGERNTYKSRAVKSTEWALKSNESVNNGAVITEPLENHPNGAVSIDFMGFTDFEKELIKLLWDNGAVRVTKPLISRDEVIKIVGNKVKNTKALTALYKKLLEKNYIYKKIGYFANSELKI